MAKNDNVVTTRLSEGAKAALVAEAEEAEITPSMMARKIITRALRRRWEIEDLKV